MSEDKHIADRSGGAAAHNILKKPLPFEGDGGRKNVRGHRTSLFFLNKHFKGNG
jgi:hypothetical protein